jgi:hypothetical protein
MGFVQIIDYHASDLDAIRAVEARWDDETKGERTARRSILCQDRTGEMQKLSDGAPQFLDLEVIDDVE